MKERMVVKYAERKFESLKRGVQNIGMVNYFAE